MLSIVLIRLKQHQIQSFSFVDNWWSSPYTKNKRRKCSNNLRLTKKLRILYFLLPIHSNWFLIAQAVKFNCQLGHLTVKKKIKDKNKIDRLNFCLKFQVSVFKKDKETTYFHFHDQNGFLCHLDNISGRHTIYSNEYPKCCSDGDIDCLSVGLSMGFFEV